MSILSLATRRAKRWLIKSLGGAVRVLSGRAGGGSHSGKAVNVQTALQIATVWACVRLISETIATLPLQVYERDVKGRRTVARNHWLYDLVHSAPNANMSAVEFWEAVVAQLCLWGNAYALKTYSGARIVSLDPLNPEWMTVKVDEHGAPLYVYKTSKGTFNYRETDVFHIKGFGIDGLIGLSPIAYARNTIGLALAADEASGKMFANGMRAGGALSTEQVLKKDQRQDIRDSIADQLAGVANTGKIMVLEAGMKYMPLSLSPQDAQMLQTRAFNVEEICRWFRTPPFMIGHTEKSSNYPTALEQQMQAFLTFALRPYLSRIEQGIARSLLSPAERRRYFAEFSLEGLLRADSAGRAALYASGAQNGWLTRNEIRELENRPPLEGGDELTVQSNLVPLRLLGKAVSAAKTAKDAILNWLELPAIGGNSES